jgi:hypothetical protein
MVAQLTADDATYGTTGGQDGDRLKREGPREASRAGERRQEVHGQVCPRCERRLQRSEGDRHKPSETTNALAQ